MDVFLAFASIAVLVSLFAWALSRPAPPSGYMQMPNVPPYRVTQHPPAGTHATEQGIIVDDDTDAPRFF